MSVGRDNHRGQRERRLSSSASDNGAGQVADQTTGQVVGQITEQAAAEQAEAPASAQGPAQADQQPPRPSAAGSAEPRDAETAAPPRALKGSARRFAGRLDLKHGAVDMSHGSGGRAMAQLIDELFHRHLSNPLLAQGNDQAVFQPPPGRLVTSTDGHVISPLFFPGGDIGSLAVHGTVNDVAMSGARPLYLTASFILEEGLPLADLNRIAASMGAAARAAGVQVVAGDTKVVERGKGDGCFIATTGIGVVPDGIEIAGDRARPGDAILVSGSLGDHGVAILSKRENLGFETEIASDSQALNDLVAAMIDAVPGIHCLRDPTRGGLATTLNELALQSQVGMLIREAAIPVRAEVNGACELLGLDPLYVANEGKLIAICPGDQAETLLAAMRAHPKGRDAAIIGEVVEDPHHFVQMETSFGGSRIVDWLAGEQLPRIC